MKLFNCSVFLGLISVFLGSCGALALAADLGDDASTISTVSVPNLSQEEVEIEVRKRYELAEQFLKDGKDYKTVADQFKKVLDLYPISDYDEYECDDCAPEYAAKAKEKFDMLEKFIAWAGTVNGEPVSTDTVKYWDRNLMSESGFQELLALRPKWVVRNRDWLAGLGGGVFERVVAFLEKDWRYSFVTRLTCGRDIPRKRGNCVSEGGCQTLSEDKIQKHIECYKTKKAEPELRGLARMRAKGRMSSAEQCLRVLSWIPPREDVLDLLVEARMHSGRGMRRTAYQGIASFKPENALQLLSAGLTDNDLDVRDDALNGILSLHDERAVQLYALILGENRLRERAFCGLIEFSEAALPYLEKAYSKYAKDSSDDGIRQRSVILSAIASVGSPAAFDSLLKFLSVPEKSLRSCACTALYMSDPVRAVPVLVPILKSADPINSVAAENIRILMERSEATVAK